MRLRSVVFSARPSASLKLLQKPDVILDEKPDVVNPVFPHGDAFDAEAEGPASVLLRINVDGFEDVGMNHAAAAELHPAAFSAGAVKPDVHLGRRFGEREKAGA